MGMFVDDGNFSFPTDQGVVGSPQGYGLEGDLLTQDLGEALNLGGVEIAIIDLSVFHNGKAADHIDLYISDQKFTEMLCCIGARLGGLEGAEAMEDGLHLFCILCCDHDVQIMKFLYIALEIKEKRSTYRPGQFFFAEFCR